MLKPCLIMATLFAATLPSHAGEGELRLGDYYVISRGDRGQFLGSHRLFKENASGLHEVSYCGETYWVRAKTVAWTQLEEENERTVNVEFNRGKGWRPICSKPGDQVSLADIGVTLPAAEMMFTSEAELKRANRFAAIGQSFRALGTSGPQGSYHAR